MKIVKDVMAEKKFNKSKYDIDYRKKHKVQFNVDLNKSEMDTLNTLLKTTNTKKSDFLRKAIRTECKENNILYFDRLAKCDWCGKKDYVSITHYGTSHYNRLICSDCANNIIEYHKTIDGTTPCWYRTDENE